MKNIDVINEFKFKLKNNLTYVNLCSKSIDEYKEFVIKLFEELNVLKIHAGAELIDFKDLVLDVYSSQTTDDIQCENRLLDLCSEISTVYANEPFFWDTDFEIYKISLIKMLESHNY